MLLGMSAVLRTKNSTVSSVVITNRLVSVFGAFKCWAASWVHHYCELKITQYFHVDFGFNAIFFQGISLKGTTTAAIFISGFSGPVFCLWCGTLTTCHCGSRGMPACITIKTLLLLHTHLRRLKSFPSTWMDLCTCVTPTMWILWRILELFGPMRCLER